MAKLKKGISNIVDEIIKENEPPEEEPSPLKRGRQPSREPITPEKPITPQKPSTPPPQKTPPRSKSAMSSSGPLPEFLSSGPLPKAKAKALSGSVPPPKTQSTEQPSKPIDL